MRLTPDEVYDKAYDKGIIPTQTRKRHPLRPFSHVKDDAR